MRTHSTRPCFKPFTAAARLGVSVLIACDRWSAGRCQHVCGSFAVCVCIETKREQKQAIPLRYYCRRLSVSGPLQHILLVLFRTSASLAPLADVRERMHTLQQPFFVLFGVVVTGLSKELF